MVETGIYFLVLLKFANRLTAAMTRPKLRRTLDRCTGAVLIGLGIRLAWD